MQQANNLLIEAQKLSLQKKERNNQYHQFEYQQRQNLMQILYLRQLESEQQKLRQQHELQRFQRSATLENINSAGFSIFNNNNPLNSNSLIGEMSSLLMDSSLLNQNLSASSGLMRSNSMFPFNNN